MEIKNENDVIGRELVHKQSLFGFEHLLIFMTRGDVRVMVIWTSSVTWIKFYRRLNLIIEFNVKRDV